MATKKKPTETRTTTLTRQTIPVRRQTASPRRDTKPTRVGSTTARRQRVGETAAQFESRMANIRFNRADADRAEERTDPTRARARRTLRQTEFGSGSPVGTPSRNYSNRRGGR